MTFQKPYSASSNDVQSSGVMLSRLILRDSPKVGLIANAGLATAMMWFPEADNTWTPNGPPLLLVFSLVLIISRLTRLGELLNSHKALFSWKSIELRSEANARSLCAVILTSSRSLSPPFEDWNQNSKQKKMLINSYRISIRRSSRQSRFDLRQLHEYWNCLNGNGMCCIYL